MLSCAFCTSFYSSSRFQFAARVIALEEGKVECLIAVSWFSTNRILMFDLPEKPHKKLTTAQQAAWGKMRALLENSTEADRQYDGMPGAEAGRVISTDLARMLDSRYAKNPGPCKLRDIEPGWDLAWRYSQDRFERELRTLGKRRRVRFMAGGWAAGKTHAVENQPSNKPDLTWDGTLKDIDWAAAVIDLAVVEGWEVEIAYIYRNLELALYGAVERRKKEGRSVPLHKLAANHREVQQAVMNLNLLYSGHPKISFLFLHNLGKRGVLSDPLNIEIKELELNGALHYLQRHEEYYAKAAKHLEQAHQARA